MLKNVLITAIVLVILGVVPGCNWVSDSRGSSEVITEGDKIFIVDRTGKRWDVTYAYENHSMEPSRFQYGLGPNAILPINSPIMLEPGDSGYPGSDQGFEVIGLSRDDDVRAYPISVLSRHEVINEEVAGSVLAVAF